MELNELLTLENIEAMKKQAADAAYKKGWVEGWRDALLFACQFAYIHGAEKSKTLHGDATRMNVTHERTDL